MRLSLEWLQQAKACNCKTVQLLFSPVLTFSDFHCFYLHAVYIFFLLSVIFTKYQFLLLNFDSKECNTQSSYAVFLLQWCSACSCLISASCYIHTHIHYVTYIHTHILACIQLLLYICKFFTASRIFAFTFPLRCVLWRKGLYLGSYGDWVS